MDLKDLVCVVTGAGKGLGKTIASKLFERGACVALWDVNLKPAQDTAESIDPSGKRAAAFRVDVTDEKEVALAVAEVLKTFGHIDVLVNNAGITLHKTLEEMTLDIFEAVMKVNLTGTFLCCRAIAPVMRKQGRGKIVNIASLAARTGRPGVGVNYACSKAGVIALTQTLARELGPAGIYINAIAPGPILTELTRQYPPEVFATWNAGRAIAKDGLPEDVAEAVVFLASKQSDWITGVTLDVNGGILMR